jgi:hypothetical protein
MDYDDHYNNSMLHLRIAWQAKSRSMEAVIRDDLGASGESAFLFTIKCGAITAFEEYIRVRGKAFPYGLRIDLMELRRIEV